MDYASLKDRKALAKALRPIYAAARADAVEGALSNAERQARWRARRLAHNRRR